MPDQNRAMYELMYVVNTVLNDDQIDEICDRVAGYIRDNDGEVIEEERWGSRRLAYPIEKKRNGYYGLVYFRSGPDFIARLDRALRINDDILRHLVLRYDAKMERHFEKQRREGAARAAAAAAGEPSEAAEAAEAEA
jgi:small subunit ribosomal protein S6